jgi:GAF domain-containing protein/anti-sigma regulatory factor (Ser/Thr protein kinase)
VSRPLGFDGTSPWKLPLLVATLILLTSGSLYWYSAGRERKSEIDSVLIHGRSLALILAANSEDAVFRQDADTLRRAVDRVAQEQDVAYALVSDSANRFKVQAGATPAPDVQEYLAAPVEQPVGESLYDISVPVARKHLDFTSSDARSSPGVSGPQQSDTSSKPAGIARVGMSLARVDAAIEQRHLAWFLMTLVLAAIGAGVAHAATRVALARAPKFDAPMADGDWEHEAEMRARELRESLAQQAATSAILRIIATSARDLQPALDAVAEHAAKLCTANDAHVHLVTGAELQWVAGFGPLPVAAKTESLPVSPGLIAGRAVLERKVIHIHDAVRELDDYPDSKSIQARAGYRTILVAPLLWQGSAIGTISIRRMQVNPFSDTQVELVKTFADQAAIAIENTRLFHELRNKNQTLAEAVEQLAATGDVLRVISSSPANLQRVLDQVTQNAGKLFDATDAYIVRVDGDAVVVASMHGSPLHLLTGERFPLRRDLVVGRAILDARTIHVPDLLAESDQEYAAAKTNNRRTGYRTMLAVPLLRGGVGIGALGIARPDVRPFSERQVRLLEAFADQAIIAIENTRLFDELQERNGALTEALEQQTATSEILRVISSSPTDLQPVLGAVVERAASLCRAIDASLVIRDGASIRRIASYGPLPVVPAEEDIPLTRDLAMGAAILDCRTIHIRDASSPEAAREYPESARMAARLGNRTVLVTPLVRKGSALGAIVIRRTEVLPFSEKQIELLQTFADQAVIAIENVRLFQELQERNKALTEALEQQTATSEILRVISSSPTDVQPVFDAISRSAVQLCDGLFSAVDRFDGELIHRVAQHNFSAQAQQVVQQVYPMRPNRRLAIARAVLDGRVVHVPDVEADPEYDQELTRAVGMRSTVAVPLLHRGSPIGAIAVAKAEPARFSNAEIALLQTFADQAVIAIENARLFKELQQRNRALTEALEQQTATSEILSVISASPTDPQPVFDTIVRSAARLCDAAFVVFHRYDGAMLGVDSYHNLTGEELEVTLRVFPRPPDPGIAAGRAVLECEVVHISDIRDDPTYTVTDSLRTIGFRTVLAVPLLREGDAMGALCLWRRTVSPFSDTQISLLKTFADQAVIAIENVRLFKELQERNKALTEALEQQTATSEILRVISSSPTDLQPVLDAVATNAARLCDAADAVVYRVDGDTMRPVAIHGTLGARSLPLNRQSVTGRAITNRQAIHVYQEVTDMDTEFPESTSREREHGFLTRTRLAVPLLREGAPLGAILIRRVESRPFSDKQIELLKTFADQAIIAIENVRLFTELQERLEQQTATSEILRVISSSPTDLQPVLDAVAQSAARLCDAPDIVVLRVEGERLALAAHRGPLTTAVREAPAIGHQTVAGRAVADRVIVHIEDLLAQPAGEFPLSREIAMQEGFRTVLAAPLLREGLAIGAIALRRMEVRPFTEKQIALLRTFADQAVIAIENSRLFKELQERNKALTEALEQQTATSDILRVISSSPLNLQAVLDAVAESSARLCAANDVAIFRVDGDAFRTAAHYGSIPITSIEERVPIRRDIATGRAILDRAVLHIVDVLAEQDSELAGSKAYAARLGYRTFLAVPMLREGIAIGAIGIRRTEVRPFSDSQIALLKAFADQAVIAIENTRLFTELQERLEQQTATSEILRVISQSQSDVQPVFEVIAASARKLCRGTTGWVGTFDGELINSAAADSYSPEALEAIHRTFPMPPSPGSALGRAILTRAVAYIPDIREDVQYTLQSLGELIGIRSVVAVPMLREGSPIGTVNVGGADPAMFSERQIAMLQTFADQAVIAVENTRLFNELQTRTQELAHSVQKLQALAEVGEAVSSTLDLEKVLETIVARATQLSSSDAGAVYEFDEASQELRLRATYGLPQDLVDALLAKSLRLGDGATGRAAQQAKPVEIADLTITTPYSGGLQDLMDRSGLRAVLAVPMLREGRVVGSFSVSRRTSGSFPAEVVELLETFAAQSTLAIQNARLFREIEQKSRELEDASRHKSQFLANMSHELRTPLNAILGYTELIVDKIYGEVPEKISEVLERVQKSGQHLLGLINDVLDLSKIEAGQLTLGLSDYAFNDVVQGVVSSVGSLAAEKQLRLTVDVAPGLPVGRGDERRIRQVLMNLVGNAIKFTETGEVTVRVSAADGTFLVAVADTGPGIREEDRQKIFEEFQQSDSSPTKTKGGTGLGLAIAKRIVEMHGGRIWVESTLGSGSTFFFSVPVHAGEQVARV